MRENVALGRLRAGQTAFGLSCQLPAPALVEIAGLVGFHFVMLDCEHGALGPETLEHLMRAAELTGTTPVVRVSRNEPDLILRYLDAMLAVDGVDVYFVGPADLSQSLGLPGELDHPRVVETVRQTVTRIRAAGRVAGAYVPDAESALAYRELGAAYLLGSLNRMLAGALGDFLRAAGR